MIDVDHRQPMLGASRWNRAGVQPAIGAKTGLRLGRRIAGLPGELLVKGLAVEQTGERVAFAVVEQTLVILVDLKNAGNDMELLRRERARLGNFEATRYFFLHPDR
jgi:hypothetical protein